MAATWATAFTRSSFLFARSWPLLNVFWDDRSRLDLTASYRIGDRRQVFGELNDITDERQRRFQGQANRVLELEGFGRS